MVVVIILPLFVDVRVDGKPESNQSSNDGASNDEILVLYSI